ncbi:MAG: ribose transport system permease protein [Solirubrobacteraceae bacterium]
MASRVQRHLWLFAAGLALALLVANIIAEPNFGNPSNWPDELATLAPLAIVAMAQTPAILSGNGGIDLSIGPLAILSNVVVVELLLPHAGLGSIWVALPIAVLLCAAVGAVNGVLVTVLRYRPVIATLCTFFVLAGLVAKIAPKPKTAADVGWLDHLGDKIAFVPGGLVLIAAPLVLWAVLGRTAFHRNLYLTGGSDATAFSAGVDVTSTRIVAYALGGGIAGLAGVALTAVVQSTQAAGYSQYTLIALAAVALGGTQLYGGRGGMVGSLLGAASIYLMQSLLSALNVSSSWLDLAYGVLLVAGVIVGAQLLELQRTTRAAA